MAVHIPTVSVPCEACRAHGSLPPRPHPLERHRRSCGRGTTATRAATYGASARAHGHGDSVHMHPDVDVYVRYATDPGRSTVKISGLWAARSARIVGRFWVSVHRDPLRGLRTPVLRRRGVV